jgi:hypothetical protein
MPVISAKEDINMPDSIYQGVSDYYNQNNMLDDLVDRLRKKSNNNDDGTYTSTVKPAPTSPSNTNIKNAPDNNTIPTTQTYSVPYDMVNKLAEHPEAIKQLTQIPPEQQQYQYSKIMQQLKGQNN